MTTAPKTIPEVLARMRAIEAALPPDDGVAWFARLYLAVTESVEEAIRPGAFRTRPSSRGSTSSSRTCSSPRSTSRRAPGRRSLPAARSRTSRRSSLRSAA